MKTPSKTLPVVHLDQDVVVINKPAGLLTHRSGLSPERISCLSLLRAQLGRHVYPVHRLDRATSGLLIFALSSAVASELGEIFRTQRAGKVYWAIVRGWVREAGVIDKALVSATSGAAQAACTAYKPLAHVERPWPVGRYPSARYTLLELRPSTGRTHQLRRHLHSLSHPIVGDTRYGDGAHNRAFRERLGLGRLMLHALELELPPIGQSPARLWRAEPDQDFKAAMTGLGFGELRIDR